MPLYEYSCGKCSRKVELLIRVDEQSAPVIRCRTRCPQRPSGAIDTSRSPRNFKKPARKR